MHPASPERPTNGTDRGLRLLLWPLLAAIVFGLIGFGEPLEDGLRIARNRLHAQPVSNNIVLVEIDEASIRRTDNWP